MVKKTNQMMEVVLANKYSRSMAILFGSCFLAYAFSFVVCLFCGSAGYLYAGGRDVLIDFHDSMYLYFKTALAGIMGGFAFWLFRSRYN